MKATRRKFFGFMGGAAVAGPTAAKSLASPIVGGGVAPSMGYAASESQLPVGGSVDPLYVLKRVADLKDKIAGKRTKVELDNERLDRLSANQATAHQIDALRSVAMHHKARMVQAAHERAHLERQKFWWQREIDQLLGFEG